MNYDIEQQKCGNAQHCPKMYKEIACGKTLNSVITNAICYN